MCIQYCIIYIKMDYKSMLECRIKYRINLPEIVFVDALLDTQHPSVQVTFITRDEQKTHCLFQGHYFFVSFGV